MQTATTRQLLAPSVVTGSGSDPAAKWFPAKWTTQGVHCVSAKNARLKVTSNHCGEKLNHHVSLHCWWRGKNAHQLLQPKDQSSLWSRDMHVSPTGNWKTMRKNSHIYLFCIFILLHSFNWKLQPQPSNIKGWGWQWWQKVLFIIHS